MPRPPVIPANKKAEIILAILSGEMTAAEAARTLGVSGQAISNWKRCFLKAGCEGLESGTGQQTRREAELMKEITVLKSALGDSYLQLQAIRSRLRPAAAPRVGRPVPVGAGQRPRAAI
ncbi:helix-turn-helix domain-containing protein [Kitasatospora sp. NPDC089509]|uniref:helix-turn-helix domain-containing protein n=1 Tax=Kitasatospora sp. NPDC089509 TaxID=3364079 RepID=UPI00382AEA8D